MALHIVDVVVASALMWLTEGTASPFFPLYVFVLVASVLRWNWRGAVYSGFGLAATLILMLLIGLPEGWGLEQKGLLELDRLILRGGLLIIGGLLLGYLGARRELSRRQFAELACWPSMGNLASFAALAPAISHAAKIMHVPRVIVAWREADEPYQFLLKWSGGELTDSRETSDILGELVQAPFDEVSFTYDGAIVRSRHFFDGKRVSASEILNLSLRDHLRLTSFATAPFEGAECSGRVFLLGRSSWAEEDLAMAEIITSRFGIELEQLVLRKRLDGAVAARERVRLARDLHDGVLQSLAAASLHLAAPLHSSRDDVQGDLAVVKSLLSDEAKRLRSFVEESRDKSAEVEGVIDITSNLAKRALTLRKNWRCDVTVDVEPKDLRTSVSNARHLGHLLSESVSNAVRHGQASTVASTLTEDHGRLVLTVSDDGHSDDVANGTETGRVPQSLKTRVDDLGGSFEFERTSTGTHLRIELPT